MTILHLFRERKKSGRYVLERRTLPKCPLAARLPSVVRRTRDVDPWLVAELAHEACPDFTPERYLASLEIDHYSGLVLPSGVVFKERIEAHGLNFTIQWMRA